MSQTHVPIRLFAALLLLWLLLSASVSIESLAIGVILAGAIAVFMNANLSYLSGYRFSPASFMATLGFLGFFIAELVKANLNMAAIVMQPVMPIDPAIVRVKTNLKHPTARLLLANAITLTPGTLSVEIKDDWLYIHWVVAETEEAEQATRAIASGFERYLEVMYG